MTFSALLNIPTFLLLHIIAIELNQALCLYSRLECIIWPIDEETLEIPMFHTLFFLVSAHETNWQLAKEHGLQSARTEDEFHGMRLLTQKEQRSKHKCDYFYWNDWESSSLTLWLQLDYQNQDPKWDLVVDLVVLVKRYPLILFICWRCHYVLAN